MDLARMCYGATESFDSDERYGIIGQIRRSAVSIPSNVAEGCGRGSRKEFVRYLRIAYASACELGTQLQLSWDLDMGNGSDLVQALQEVDRVRRMLTSLIRSVESEL